MKSKWLVEGVRAYSVLNKIEEYKERKEELKKQIVECLKDYNGGGNEDDNRVPSDCFNEFCVAVDTIDFLKYRTVKEELEHLLDDIVEHRYKDSRELIDKVNIAYEYVNSIVL